MPNTTLADLQTPSLVLDQAKLLRNIRRMSAAAGQRGINLRPHLKTAKSIDVAWLALEGQPGGIVVSTLLEAEYFAQQGIKDILYGVCITPDKLDRAAAIQTGGIQVTLVTDSIEGARAIVDKSRDLDEPFVVQAELDCGEGRTGVDADGELLLEIARIIDGGANTVFDGVMTHAGHSYRCRTVPEIEAVAEQERRAAVTAAERIREQGIQCNTVSVGSTPTALHATSAEGITELRAGVYVFGDMFQAQIHSCTQDDIAISVLADIISHNVDRNQIVVDAGSLALSQDRSTADTPNDIGYGFVAMENGQPFSKPLHVARVHQEHGQIPLPQGLNFADFPIGSRVRIYPNHACITAAMYDRYHVVDSENGTGRDIVATWPRINGW